MHQAVHAARVVWCRVIAGHTAVIVIMIMPVKFGGDPVIGRVSFPDELQDGPYRNSQHEQRQHADAQNLKQPAG